MKKGGEGQKMSEYDADAGTIYVDDKMSWRAFNMLRLKGSSMYWNFNGKLYLVGYYRTDYPQSYFAVAKNFCNIGRKESQVEYFCAK